MSDSEPEENDLNSVNSDGDLSETSDTEQNNPTFIKNDVKEPNVEDDESSLYDDEIEDIDLEDPSNIIGPSSISKSINSLIDNKKLGMENFNTEIEYRVKDTLERKTLIGYVWELGIPLYCPNNYVYQKLLDGFKEKWNGEQELLEIDQF